MTEFSPFSSLLLAVDASPYAAAATRYAGFLSRQLGLPLRALHVLDARAAAAPSTFGAGTADVTLLTPQFDPAVESVIEEQAEAVRTKTDAELGRLGLDTRLEVATGTPVPDLLERADAQTLLVMGKAGESAAAGAEVRLGGVAERAVRRAEGAVLLVPERFTEPGRLLLGYDGKGGAEAALGYTFGLAHALKLPVLAVNVGDDEGAAEAVLGRVRARAAEENVTLGAETRRGRPGTVLAEAAREGDLIVIGAFGTGRLAEFFGGSTTEEVIVGAAVPVLLHG